MAYFQMRCRTWKLMFNKVLDGHQGDILELSSTVEGKLSELVEELLDMYIMKELCFSYLHTYSPV